MASTKANAPKISTRPLPDFTANPEFWPVLPALEAWQDTRDTVHMWTQIVGKVRLALNPLINHWWEVPLYVSPRGLTTSIIPYARGIFEVALIWRLLGSQGAVHPSATEQIPSPAKLILTRSSAPDSGPAEETSKERLSTPTLRPSRWVSPKLPCARRALSIIRRCTNSFLCTTMCARVPRQRQHCWTFFKAPTKPAPTRRNGIGQSWREQRKALLRYGRFEATFYACFPSCLIYSLGLWISAYPGSRFRDLGSHQSCFWRFAWSKPAFRRLLRRPQLASRGWLRSVATLRRAGTP